ncbi:helix-turn-helix domain-containing protein [Scandinavium sp. NPDC088450]|uniref:helix-turn-helix domain-containing protein n=1 Tax=Scandinavium sp. NPDC088450 TaxID=3364514 RepID=UPI00384F733B
MNESASYQSIFCERLKSARLAKGLSQKKLGILAGIDEFVASTRINRYEKGVHQASIEVVHQLAKALDIPLAYFYTEDDDLALLLMSWKQIDSETKKKLLAYLTANS